VAAIDSSPVRGRSMLGANKPPRLLNVVAGVGVTPRAGLRLGAALAHGAYVSVNEVVDKTRGDRDATMIQLEGEWAFGHTRVAGEWIRSTMETSTADAQAQGSWIEATQTLTPRVFLAGRVDSQYFRYPLRAPGALGRQDYQRYETILGFRLTPDLTVRAGHMVRKGYVVAHWDDQLIASVVWQRRLW
jgi:hypothetical protein